MENNGSINRSRAKRVTVDIDKPSRLKLLKVFFNAKHFFPNAPIKVFETGKGNHIRIFQSGLTVEANISVRRHLGDDFGKFRFDELRIRAKKVWVLKGDTWHLEVDNGLISWVDTGFEHKFKDGKWTREELCNPLAEPFFSRMPARKLRNHL